MTRILGLFLTALAAVWLGSVPARAQQRPAPAPAPPASLAPGQAQQALDVLRDDKRRAELIATLEAIAKTTPAPAPSPAPALPLVPNSLGAQVVSHVSASVSQAGEELAASVRAANDLPVLGRWIAGQVSDPAARGAIGDALWRLALIALCAGVAEWAVRRGFGRLRNTLAQATPPTQAAEAGVEQETGLQAAEAGKTEREEAPRRRSRALAGLRRLPYLAGLLGLELLPIAAFLFTAEFLAGSALAGSGDAGQVIHIWVHAYVAARVIVAFGDFLVSPAAPRLRLLHVSQWAASLLSKVIRRTVIVALAGIALADSGLAFGMSIPARDALLKLFALAIHLGFVLAVLQAREPVAIRLRNRAESPRAARVFGRLAEIWHILAIFVVVALWVVWAIELRNGYVRLAAFCLSTASVLIAARVLAVFLLGGVERLRAGADEAASKRGPVYFPVLRATVMAVLWGATAFALLGVWGFAPLSWITGDGLGGRVVSALVQVGVTALIALAVWEVANAGIERHLARLSESAQLARAGRLRTLLPLLRTVLLVTIILVVVLMALSELGVNIAPLLAGAGVVGIAVGFGSQKLVQDLITGLFLLLENAMQVGDVVTVAALTGTVEALSIRTIRLRALDGAVHLIPFSAVTTVTNQTRDFSYALLDVSVGLNEEPDPIAQVLRDVAEAMRADPAWGSLLLEELEVMGVEKLTDLAWIMRIRIKTQAGSRWAVARELNRRIKVRFDELAIESPFTSHRVLGREPPAAPVPQQAQEQPA